MKLNTFFIITMVSIFAVSAIGQSAFGYGGPPENNSANNYTVEITSNQESYALGESVMFTGSVNKYDEDRSLRISVFDSSNNLIITKKTPVDTYGKFSYTVELNEKFSDGKYIVKSQYGSSKFTVSTSSFMITTGNTSTMTSNVSEIPSWIKNNAGWWADGSIDDASFVQGIQFLVKEGIMKVLPEQASDVAKPATQMTSSKQTESSKSSSNDPVIASLEDELEKCSEIVKSYKRLDCEKPIKQEILVHTYKTGAELFQVGVINYYWFGVNSDGNGFEISPTGQPILSIRMLAENTSSDIMGLNCTSPVICNYDVWDGSKAFKYSGMDFTSGQINLNPGTAKEFNILFGPNIGYGGTKFEYDSSKSYEFRINESFGSLNIHLDLE